MNCSAQKVSKILKIYEAEQGCTCPLKIELQDGKEAVLKYPENPHGTIVLVNEYLSCLIARKIQLTSPDFGLAFVEEDVRCGDGIIGSNFLGLGFYSEYIPKTFQISSRTAKRAENIGELCKLILFDHIVKNGDRHSGNVLISFATASPKFYAIDHSHALGDPDWDESTLLIGDAASPYVMEANGAFYKMLEDAGAPITLEQLRREAELISEKLDDDFLNDICESVPEEWVSVIGADKIAHVREYLQYKVHNLSVICETIIRERSV